MEVVVICHVYLANLEETIVELFGIFFFFKLGNRFNITIPNNLAPLL